MNYFIIVIILLLTIYLFKNNGDRKSKINKKIPGPFGIPIFGNLLSMSGNLHLKFEQWYKQYGSVYRIKMGCIETVVLTEYPTLRKAFIENSEIFKNRFRYKSRFQINNCQDIAMQNGDTHTLLKKIILSEMTPTRIKKNEIHIIKECEKLIHLLDSFSESGEAFQINDYMSMFSLNITLRLIFGVDYPYNQVEESHDIVNAIKEFLVVAGIPILSDFIPYLKQQKGGIFMVKYNEVINQVDILIKKYQDDQNSKKDGQDDEEDVDKLILGQLLKEFDKGNISWECLTNTIIDVVIAGGDTSSSVLIFAIIELINNQNIQLKLYNDLESNDEKNVLAVTQGKYGTTLPYLSLIIKESYRKYPVSLLGLPHVTTEDIVINGHLIAEGTQIIQNIYATHRSDIYVSPDQFIPERFIELANNVDQATTVQFGLGPRDCLGKNMGTSLIFTLLATLFNRYEFINPNPNQALIDIGQFGITYQAPKTTIIIKKRN